MLPRHARGLGLAVGVVASLSVAAVACIAIRRRLCGEQRRKEEEEEEKKQAEEEDQDVDTILAGTVEGWAQGEQEPELGEELEQGLILDAELLTQLWM